MIGTFWNLCRACPSMPVDKLHSEYRSTYRWHEYTGPRQEIIRRPPQPTPAGSGNIGCGGKWVAATAAQFRNEENKMKVETTSGFEPALPRRKKNPALAYKTHEFIVMSDCDGSNDSLDTSIPVDRARMIASYIPTTGTTQPSGGVLKNAISRISTEYRLQFNWPRGSCGHDSTCEEIKADYGSGLPRKSLSMGAIKPSENITSINNSLAPVHRKKVTNADRQGGGFELEPLVGSTADMLDDEVGEEKIREETWDKGDKTQLRAELKTEYKKRFRPFSQYDYIEGRFKPKKEEIEPLPLHHLQDGDSWYREVLELRKKAGEYKHRGWGTELVPEHIAELYNKQMTLWEQVSRRSSLSALSLASTTPRSVSKEEKEKENNNKSSPTKVLWPRRQSPSRTAVAQSSQKKVEKIEENKKETPRSRKEAIIRHHLERTTGAVDGALLHSPTREKLEPVVSRRKDNNPELAVNKSSQKISHITSGRSQSVGPEIPMSSENLSPKRISRGHSSTKTQMNGPVATERHSRPTTLTTTAPFRTKSSSGSVKLTDSTKHKYTSASKSSEQSAKVVSAEESKRIAEDSPGSDDVTTNKDVEQKSESLIDIEPVIKSPPEPTRVKSPEQILMRSPEPVNWTVPLDTGKTFTVTQNVLEGEMTGRAHSEAKAWTPPAAPPAAPLSAPPQLPETEGWMSPAPELPGTTMKDIEILNTCGNTEELEDKEQNIDTENSTLSALLSTKYNSMPEGTSGANLEDPLEPTESVCKPKKSESCIGPYNDFETEDLLSKSSISPPSGKSLATDVLEKARTRFDKFWGKGKESPEKEGKV